jgi:hypothetical protein
MLGHLLSALLVHPLQYSRTSVLARVAQINDRLPMDHLHQALRTEVAASADSSAGVHFVMVRLQNSKDDVRFSLHARPTRFSTAGPQTTDMLGMLGFKRSACAYVSGSECYCTIVDSTFDVTSFAQAFSDAYKRIDESRRNLEACGIFLPFNEGWGFFYGRYSESHYRQRPQAVGDAHTAAKSSRMKESEDDAFSYVFTWIETGAQKGWTTHYRPKHPPLSPELESAFTFLLLRRFDQCPEFDFEPCHWRFTASEPQGPGAFSGNADIAHRFFDAHADRFSSGLEQLLAAQAAMQPFGFTIIPEQPQPRAVRTATSERTKGSPLTARKAQTLTRTYDVAISFAGTERAIAEQLATAVRDAGYEPFYDAFAPEQLWGKDLAVFFERVYREHSRYCVILVSNTYLEREWTNFERQNAVARSIREKGNEYILPVKVEDVELPGVSPTIGYVSLNQFTVEQIAKMLIAKLG